MEEAPGVQLHKKWPQMNSLQHMHCVESMVALIKEMSNIRYPAYGSIYFADAPIDSKLKIKLVDGFCVGPSSGSPLWPCSPEVVSTSNGITSIEGCCELHILYAITGPIT